MELSLFQKILLATDGTVTDLLALYTGEAIRVVKLEHAVSEQEAPAMLACSGATALLSRKILLTAGGRNWLHAESVFVLERMLPSIRQQLLESDRPIGLLWKEARLETYREIVTQKLGPSAAIAGYFGLPETAEFVSRTYVIHNNGKPLGAITEQWPLSLFRDEDVSRGA